VALIPMEFPELRHSENCRLFDLRFLAYTGGASLDCWRTGLRTFNEARNARALGRFLPHRVAFLRKLYEALRVRVIAGESAASTYSRLRSVFLFYAWADRANLRVDVVSAEGSFYEWCDYLYTRTKGKACKRISKTTANGIAGRIDPVFVKALGLSGPLIAMTPLARRPMRQLRVVDSADLRELETFGRALAAICNALTPDVTLGPLPVTVQVADHGSIVQWCGLLPPERVAAQWGHDRHKRNASNLARMQWEADRSSRTRRRVFNLRILSEMLIFIAQTSMNLAQVANLKRGRFRSYAEGDRVAFVRAYKGRRRGEVEFRAFRSYRGHLAQYLEWLDSCIPKGETRLFPYVRRSGGESWKSICFQGLRAQLTQLGVPFFGPQILRNVKVNWLAERIGNRNISVQAAQHLAATNAAYQRPNLAVAMGEISAFNKLLEQSLAALGPGQCATPFQPRWIAEAPPGATSPDCASPAGCLFCANHMDVQSFDYVWSLASYRELKHIEIRGHRDAPDVTAQVKSVSRPAAVLAAERANQKLAELNRLDAQHSAWVVEAAERVREGRFHAKWSGFIRIMEL